jgi:hypothetical protein
MPERHGVAVHAIAPRRSRLASHHCHGDVVAGHRARGAVWLVVALAAGLAIVAVWGFRTGVGVDSGDPAGSMCTIGPATGVPAAWVLTVAGAVVIDLAVRRAIRGRRQALSR